MMFTKIYKGSKIPFFLFVGFVVAVNFTYAQNPVMPRLPMTVLVEGVDTNIFVFQKKEKKIQAAVKGIFDLNQLDHEFSKAYDKNASFEVYWKNFSKYWFCLDMDADKIDEIIFSGPANSQEAKEYFQLYRLVKGEYKQLFWDDGHFAGFLKHPNTKELLVVHHRYPCCYNASHNINKIRLVNGELQFDKRLLLARDTGMKGTSFFPNVARFDAKVYLLKKETPLYWSSEIIEKDAFSYSPTNQITQFPAGTSYQVINKKGNWNYVMVLDAPPNLPSRIINPANLSDTKLMGWFYMP
ncbi:MAG: hypothetical protein KJ941_00725 [Bacteroidetes bacterium]|nr:hypothetical protein [Bacteroidota bacterium]